MSGPGPPLKGLTLSSASSSSSSRSSSCLAFQASLESDMFAEIPDVKFGKAVFRGRLVVTAQRFQALNL